MYESSFTPNSLMIYIFYEENYIVFILLKMRSLYENRIKLRTILCGKTKYLWGIYNSRLSGRFTT